MDRMLEKVPGQMDKILEKVPEQMDRALEKVPEQMDRTLMKGWFIINGYPPEVRTDHYKWIYQALSGTHYI